MIDFQDMLLESVRQMAKASPLAAEAAAQIICKLEEVSQSVINGDLDIESAKISTNNYMHALDMVRAGFDNEQQVEAYLQAKTSLAISKALIFTALKIGLDVYAPGSSTLLEGVGKLALREASKSVK